MRTASALLSLVLICCTFVFCGCTRVTPDHGRQVLPADLNEDLPRRATDHFRRGLHYLGEDDYDGAIAEFSEAVEIAPHTRADWYEFRAACYEFRALCYDYKGDYDLAMADYNEAIELDPRRASAYNGRGMVYAYQRDYDNAIGDYTKAIELDPSERPYFLNRAFVYNRNGNYDGAIADLNRFLSSGFALVRVHFVNERSSYIEGNYDESRAHRNKMLALYQQLAEASYQRAWAYLNKGDDEQAISDLNRCLELDAPPHVHAQAREALRALGEE